MKQVPLTDRDRELLARAIETSDRLYLRNVQEVAAAARTTSGEIYCGIHFETKVGWANVCGEVAAICCMIADGHRDLDTIVAVWRNAEGRHYLLPPCGRCREVISDLNREAWVIVSTRPSPWDSDSIDYPCKVSVSELLPMKPPGGLPSDPFEPPR